MNVYRKALNLQLLYVLLVIVWNAVGLWQKHQSVQSIGPVASLTVITLALLIGFGLIWTTKRQLTKSYFALSVCVLLMASMSVYRAFSDDPLWWLSEFWRYLGAAINGIGIVGFLVLISSQFNKIHDSE